MVTKCASADTSANAPNGRNTTGPASTETGTLRSLAMLGRFPQSRVEAPAPAGPHAHHMVLETPNGAMSRGRCKTCGYTRDYQNWIEDGGIIEKRKGNERNNRRRLDLKRKARSID